MRLPGEKDPLIIGKKRDYLSQLKKKRGDPIKDITKGEKSRQMWRKSQHGITCIREGGGVRIRRKGAPSVTKEQELGRPSDWGAACRFRPELDYTLCGKGYFSFKSRRGEGSLS